MTSKLLRRISIARPWERDMTVCIAARCLTKDSKHCIVTVSDTKLSTGVYSGEMTTLKLRTLSDNWKCLVAGTFAHHVPLVRHITNDLRGCKQSYDDIVRICTGAFIAENKRLAEETILSPYGLTLDEFISSREKLGESIFERTWGDIGRIKIECQLLVCGFDSAEQPHILIVENPEGDRVGFTTNCDFPGFASIGSGSYLADSTLYAIHQHSVRSVEETIYATTLAKFTAESASDVGEETYVRAILPDGGFDIDNSFSLVTDLRELWKMNGRLSIPKEALEVIREHRKQEPPVG